MKIHELGDATLHGWKAKVADEAARRAPLRDDYVRVAFGVVFVALSVQYLVKTARALASRR
jgi:hypothetical protein